MITTKAWKSIFDNDHDTIKDFYRDGRLIGQSRNGRVKRIQYTGERYDSMTRAKGFRYWTKYFKGRYCWDLPEALQEAIEMESRSHGSFIRNGEEVGYEG